MKNLIISVLVLTCLFFAGCSSKNEELVELNKANAGNVTGTSENVVTVETVNVNSDMSAGDFQNSQPIVVYICGCVSNPGVYELENGSRIFDAVEAAGGFTADAYEKYLNLAKVITDEQMIYVPSFAEYEELANGENGADAEMISKLYSGGGDGASGGMLNGGALGDLLSGDGASGGSVPGGGALDGGASGAVSGLININTATAEQLMTIPGIGQSKAEKIINYRTQNGSFKSPEDIMQISGIKEGMYNKIKDYICVK